MCAGAPYEARVKRRQGQPFGTFAEAIPNRERRGWEDASVPSDRTTVTELGTGLGMLGLDGLEEAVRSRTSVMHSLSPEMWDRLDHLRVGGAYDGEFHAAWANGQAFLTAADGLRGRLPQVVEWKGTGRAPGDEVAPIDLRVDHVYLVSCKYLSKILFNVSPTSIFDSLLFGGQGRAGRAAREELPGSGDWYAEVAPNEYQALYEAVRLAARRAENTAPSPSDRAGEVGTSHPASRRHGVAGSRRRGIARRARTASRRAAARAPPRSTTTCGGPHRAATGRTRTLAPSWLAPRRQGPLRLAVRRSGTGVGAPLGSRHG